MPPPGSAGTLVGEKYLDVPTQRLLAVGLLVAAQAVKAGDFLANFTDYNDVASYKLLLKWCCIDAALLWLIPMLRIPRLAFDTRARTAQILLFLTFNWLLFGNYSLSLGRFLPVPVRGLLNIFEYDELAISQKRVKIQDVVDSGVHLLGQHTVRLSPISTARMNPENLPFCLASPALGVFIPILLNNTKNPSFVSYSVAALADQGPRTLVNVTSKELKKMQATAASLIAEQERLYGSVPSYDVGDDEDDEFAEDNGTVQLYKRRAETNKDQQLILSSSKLSQSKLSLEKTQQLLYLRVTRPGLVRLERLLDGSGSDARIRRRTEQVEATVVECPSASFEADTTPKVQCAGSGSKDATIRVRGTVPMTLNWHYLDSAGKSKPFVVEGIKGSTEADGLPLAQDVRIPLTLRLDSPGVHVYSLDSLTDGAGNVVEMDAKSSTSLSRRSFIVRGRSSASFRGCGTSSDKAVSLLQGKTSKLLVTLNEADETDGPWAVQLRYDPPVGSEKNAKSPETWTREFTIPTDKRTIAVIAEKAGDYTILSVRGQSCTGEVFSPETCRVIEQPVPTAEIEFNSIHECASDTGVTAIALLHGTPPFVLSYTVKHDKSAPKTITKTFSSQRAEIILKPEDSGEYTYTFNSVSDKNYANIPLKGSPSTTQRVHPLAMAQFGRRARRPIVTCSGDTVGVPLELRGTPPFNIEFQLVGPKGSEIVTKTISYIQDYSQYVFVPIMKDLDANGGAMEVNLVSIEDATGCKRPLDSPGASVIVKRVKPSIKFYYPQGSAEILTLERETAQLPIRITGDGPWIFRYTRTPLGSDVEAEILDANSFSPNDKLSVQKEGTYKLTELSDAYCPGEVNPEAATFTVKWVPKPSGAFSTNAGEMTTTGAIERRPVCVGVDDFVDVDLSGRPPFQVAYSYSNQLSGRDKVEDQEVFNSIQTTSRIQLRTSQPGHHQYHLSHVGDAAYPLPAPRERSKSSPRYSGTVLKQEVLPRPSVYFKSAGPASYCLNEALVPRPGHYDDPTVVLVGKAPFKLTLSIKNVATSEIRTAVVDVLTNEWKVEVPTYSLQTVGPHQITIESFQDSSSCSPSPVDPELRTFAIEVAETAAIVPFDRRQDWCVGDVLQFQLEGNAPWRIDYRFNGKAISATSKIPKFSRVAEKAGQFEITAVAHQQASCQSSVSDMKMTIRDLPSARVSHGNNILEDLKEGDQAEIVFTLMGTPPFTFTYQRASLDAVNGVHQVLETHTVSGVTSKEYSIFSALEGTWTVTFIADKYCRYPPAPPRADSSL